MLGFSLMKKTRRISSTICDLAARFQLELRPCLHAPSRSRRTQRKRAVSGRICRPVVLTGGGATFAKSAAVAASASTGGSAASARSAAAAVKKPSFSRRRRSKLTRTQSPTSGFPQSNHTLSWLPGRVAESESVEERVTRVRPVGWLAPLFSG